MSLLRHFMKTGTCSIAISRACALYGIAEKQHKCMNWTGFGVIFFLRFKTNQCVCLRLWEFLSQRHLDVPACWSKQLDLDQRAGIIMDQALVSDDVFRHVWEGQALLEMLWNLFHLFFYSSPNLGAFLQIQSSPASFFLSAAMTQEKAGPCSQPCRPHWMRLSWAVINLGCPIIPLYLFNGCYLPSSEGLSCWSRPRMRGGRGRRRTGRGGGVYMGGGGEGNQTKSRQRWVNE